MGAMKERAILQLREQVEEEGKLLKRRFGSNNQVRSKPKHIIKDENCHCGCWCGVPCPVHSEDL